MSSRPGRSGPSAHSYLNGVREGRKRYTRGYRTGLHHTISSTTRPHRPTRTTRPGAGHRPDRFRRRRGRDGVRLPRSRDLARIEPYDRGMLPCRPPDSPTSPSGLHGIALLPPVRRVLDQRPGRSVLDQPTNGVPHPPPRPAQPGVMTSPPTSGQAISARFSPSATATPDELDEDHTPSQTGAQSRRARDNGGTYEGNHHDGSGRGSSRDHRSEDHTSE